MRPRLAWLAVALAALGLAVAYASVTARLAGRIALPLDDAYRYLTFDAQTPSVSWSLLLTIPKKLISGAALVTATFWIAAVLYAITVANVFAIARRLGGAPAGMLAAVATLAIAPLAWTSFAGLEVALVAACWTGALALFDRRDDGPGLGLFALLVVLGLARQEAIVVVAMIAAAGAWRTVTWRALILWLAPILPAAIWLATSTVRTEQAPDLEALRGDGAPLAIAFAALWLVGVIRLRGAFLVVLTPIAFLIAGGGAPAFAVFAIAVGAAAMPIAASHVRIAGAVIATLALAALGAMPLRASIVHFAQDASDLHRRVAPFAARFAEADVIAAHDPAAVAFYSGRRTIAIDRDPAEGPGARFERLERLDERPTHFVSSPLAIGFDALFGEARAFAPPGPKLAARTWTRGEVQWIEARWDHAHSAERPLSPHPGWRLVDRIDVADLDDEAAHGWTARALGKQATLLHRETTPALALDGGRTIAGDERFRITADPARRVMLVLRTGGSRQYPEHDALSAGATLQIAGKKITVPAPRGALVEVAVELPEGTSAIAVDTDGPYRAFHWFVLQPR